MKAGKVAMYIRLSDADMEVSANIKDESDSITNQRRLISGYIRDQSDFDGFEIIEYYDDGFTGTEFDKRAEFQAMIQDAKSHRFEALVVKDFSRIGRDYIEVGDYLEYLFPSLGIRVISINDGYDSDEYAGISGGMEVAFKNLIYDLYSRDLSKKVRTARYNRNRNGEYTGAFVCYGYKKDPRDKHRLIVDEEAAEVVREIFEMSAKGISAAQIARNLNQNGVPTRLKNQWKNGIRYNPVHDKGDYLWSGSAVLSILANRQYTGVMIQNRHEWRGIGKTKKLVKRDESEWNVIEGAFPAIVIKKLFDQVNENRPFLGKKKSKAARRTNLFVCPYCDRKLIHSGVGIGKYFCPKANMERFSSCQQICMRVDEAEKMVLEVVKEEISLRCERTISSKDYRKSNIRLSAIDKEIVELEGMGVTEYAKYRDGLISREEFIERKSKRKQILENLLSEAEELRKKIETDNVHDQKAEHLELSKLDKYDGNLLSEIVEKVLIYNEKDLEVVFK